MVMHFTPKLWLAGGLALAWINLSAETTPASASSPVTGSERTAAEDKASGANLLSPHMTAELRKTLPTYIQVPPAARKSIARTDFAKPTTEDGAIVMLPNYVVRDLRLPKTEELLSPEGKLERYLGPKDGFDRGLLNRVPLHWDFGPVAVSLFGAMKNDARAELLHREKLRLENRAELLDLSDMFKRTGDVEAAKQVKRESDQLYIRDSGSGPK